MASTTVLITGASKGIGLTIAKHLAQNKGYKVYGTSRNPDQQLAVNNGFTMLALDLNDPTSIESLANQFPEGVDILINNAGQSQLGAFEDIPHENFQNLFETNFFGALKLTRALLPGMRKRGEGLIINTSSLIASFPLPFYTSYTTSKAALSAFSFSLNMELKPFGINVVVVEPNDLKTTIEPELFLKEGSAYTEKVTKMREKVRTNMSKSQDAGIVINVIDKIIGSKNPKPKYVVGGNSNMLIFVKRFISSAMQLKLTMGSYKD
ncbi:SDR family oxidoreductase [Fulvivirga sp. 29W222]|uniref:SDR family oxidoreductase n=1 Tax=Fulvivirga marina TaxID=2494733 RepID=A0A937FY70_9BACT|nr:SDR family oxidoreductase [Fulvivirga marina]MBL6447163.1 SDR family oxidoreductase [Fulvivirga marina]